MFKILRNFFGSATPTPFADLIAGGAIIVDVRSAGEYVSGHVKGSLNIPLNSLPAHLAKLSKQSPLITCCASGMRSASAVTVLKNAGFTDVYNGGSWHSLTQFTK